MNQRFRPASHDQNRRLLLVVAAGCIASFAVACKPNAPAAPPAGTTASDSNDTPTPEPAKPAPPKIAKPKKKQIPPASPPKPALPGGRIVFQPEWTYANKEPQYQGTGFFVKNKAGKIIAVTSAHFIDFDGPPLEKAVWLYAEDGTNIATMTQAWGKPGHAGTMQPPDLRSDHFLLKGPDKLKPGVAVLEIDERGYPRVGERIWFPCKTSGFANGFTVIEGAVAKSSDKAVYVRLDRQAELESCSGSPIISQSTGKVIGTLTGGGAVGGAYTLILAPCGAIHDAIEGAKDSPELRTVVGK